MKNNQILVVVNFDELASRDDAYLYRYMVYCFQTTKQLRFPKNVTYDCYKVTRYPERIIIDLFLNNPAKQTQKHVFQFGIQSMGNFGHRPAMF